MLVVSGSCSPVTGKQIGWALRNGFVDVPVDLARGDFEGALKIGELALSRGESPVIYTAAGPGDIVLGANGNELGAQLGALAGTLARRSGVRRIMICGGDTSGHAGGNWGLRL